jgi:hypothetical protein
VACRNPVLAKERARKRTELLDATEAELATIALSVQSGRLKGADKIGMRVGRYVNRYKMAKHFEIVIGDDSLSFSRRQGEIDAEASLDGVYVIRTSVDAGHLDASGAVTAYKGLSVVERDFRSLKAIDLDLRPVFHFTEDRVRAHVFICMLAAYVVWHLRKAWAPLCFTDEEPPGRDDPVAPAVRSDGARRKDARKLTATGDAVHDLSSLLDHLATLTRNTVVFTGGVRIEKLTLPTPLQRRAFELIGAPIPTKLGPM